MYESVHKRDKKVDIDDTGRYNDIRKNIGTLKYMNYTHASKSFSFMHKKYLCVPMHVSSIYTWSIIYILFFIRIKSPSLYNWTLEKIGHKCNDIYFLKNS